MFVDIIYDTDGCPCQFISQDDMYCWNYEDVAFSYYKDENGTNAAIERVMANHPDGHLITLDGITAYTIWASTASAKRLYFEE
jgi:hypothetical protein